MAIFFEIGFLAFFGTKTLIFDKVVHFKVLRCHFLCFFNPKPTNFAPSQTSQQRGGALLALLRGSCCYFLCFFDPKPSNFAPSRTSQQRGAQPPSCRSFLGQYLWVLGRRNTKNKNTKLLGIRYAPRCLVNSRNNKQCTPLINKARFARFCRGCSAYLFANLLNNAAHNECLGSYCAEITVTARGTLPKRLSR